MSRRLLPEWAPQDATLLVWPAAGGDCATNLNAVRDVIARMARELARHESVLLVAADVESRTAIAARSDLAGLGVALRVIDCPADDLWARDFGPLTVFDDGRRCFVDFRFDGWNRRYPSARDDRITATLHAAGALGEGAFESVPTVLEGGSIDGNGNGALLTTRRCLLDNNRNPGFNAGDFEAVFARRLGVDTVHWLAAGELIGDDTDGHIDTLARFTAVDAIVYQGCDDEDDAHHAALAAMAAELGALRDRHGRPYTLRRLPLPAPVFDPEDGRRLAAGYANFVIANGSVLMPAFDDPADAQAADVLRACFPDRRVVPVDCRPLIRHNGSLHCVAMQLPRHG